MKKNELPEVRISEFWQKRIIECPNNKSASPTYGPTRVKCWLLNSDIFLNELLTFSWKCPKLNSDISKNMSEIHSKICRDLKADI